MPSRFAASASSGITKASTSRTVMPLTSTRLSCTRAALPDAVGGLGPDRVVARRGMDAEPRGRALAQRDHRGAGVDHEFDRPAVDPRLDLEMAAAVAVAASPCGSRRSCGCGGAACARRHHGAPTAPGLPTDLVELCATSPMPIGGDKTEEDDEWRACPGPVVAAAIEPRARPTAMLTPPRACRRLWPAMVTAACRGSLKSLAISVPRGLARRVAGACSGSSGQGWRG